MPPKIESKPVILSDTSFESFSDISEHATSVTLDRYSGNFIRRPDAPKVSTALLNSLKEALLDHYTTKEYRPQQTYHGQSLDVANKHISSIIDSVITGYQNKAPSGKSIREIMGKVDTYVKSLAFSTKDFKNAAQAATTAHSSVYARLKENSKEVELHTRSFLGDIGHSIAKWFGSKAAKEQDSMTREILNIAIQTREQARSIGLSKKSTVTQDEITSAVRLLPAEDKLKGPAITTVFTQLKNTRNESAERVYMKGIASVLKENPMLSRAMDSVWLSNKAYYESSPSALRSIVRSTLNHGNCLAQLAKELASAGLVDQLKADDFLTNRANSQLPRLKTPTEFILHCLNAKGGNIYPKDAAELLARYEQQDSDKIQAPADMHLIRFARTDPKEYGASTLWNDMNAVMRAHLATFEDNHDGANSFDCSSRASILRAIQEHCPPDTKERFEILKETWNIYLKGRPSFEDRVACTVRLHCDGAVPTADEVKSFLAEMCAKQDDNKAFCERKTIEWFCPTLEKHIIKEIRIDEDKRLAEENRIRAELIQKRKEAEEAKAKQEAIKLENEKLVNDELAKKITVSAQDGESAIDNSYMSTPEYRADFIKLHFTPDAEGRLHLNARGERFEMVDHADQTDKITDVFSKNHIELTHLHADEYQDSLVVRLDRAITQAIDIEVAKGNSYGEVYERIHNNFTGFVLNLNKELNTDTMRATSKDMYFRLCDTFTTHPHALLRIKPEDASKFAKLTLALFKSPAELFMVHSLLREAMRDDSGFASVSSELQLLAQHTENLHSVPMKQVDSLLGSAMESRYGDRIPGSILQQFVNSAKTALEDFAKREKLKDKQPDEVKTQLQNFQDNLYSAIDAAIAVAPNSGSADASKQLEDIISTAQKNLYAQINWDGQGKDRIELIGGTEWGAKLESQAMSLASKLRLSYFLSVAMKISDLSFIYKPKQLNQEWTQMRSEILKLMPTLLAFRPYLNSPALSGDCLLDYMKVEERLLDRTFPQIGANEISELNKFLARAIFEHADLGVFAGDTIELGLTSEGGKRAMMKGATALENSAKLLSFESIHKQMLREAVNSTMNNLPLVQAHRTALGDDMTSPLKGLARCFNYSFVTKLVASEQLEPVVKAIFDGYQAMLKACTKGGVFTGPPAEKLFKKQSNFSAISESIQELANVGSAPLLAMEKTLQSISPDLAFPKNAIPNAVSIMCHMLSTHLKNLDAAKGGNKVSSMWGELQVNCRTIAPSTVVEQAKTRFETAGSGSHIGRVRARCEGRVLDWITDIRNGNI